MGSTQQPSIERRHLALIAVVVALAAFGASARSLTAEFVWDDRWLILENSGTRDFRGLVDALGQDYFHGAEYQVAYGYYRPVPTATFAVTRWVAGDDPMPFHATNVVLHCVASLLVMLLGLELGLTLRSSAAGALLFAVHPIHVESVCWIAGRTDVLATAFGLGSLLVGHVVISRWDHLSRSRRGVLIGVSTVLAAFAVLSKEIAIVIPLCLLLMARGRPKAPTSWSRLIVVLSPMVLLIAGYGLFRLLVVAPPHAELDGTGFEDKLSSAFAGVVRYVALFTAPLEQRPYMQVPMTTSLLAPLSLLGLVAVIGVVVLWRRRSRVGWRLAVMTSCFMLSIVPILNIVRISSPSDMGFTMAERFLYFPSVFLCLLCGVAVGWVLSMERRRMVIALTSGGALLLLCTATSHSRASTWNDEITLFSEARRTAPQAPLPAVLLSQAFRRAGRIDESIEELEGASQLYRDLGERPPVAMHVTLAGAMLARGRLDDAAALLENPEVQALQAPGVHRDLSIVYRLQRRLDEAEEQLERALELEPDDPRSWLQLTLLHLQRGDFEPAQRAADQARELSPGDPSTHHAAGLVARARGDRREAERELRSALTTGGENGRVLVDLGVLLSEAGQHEEAVRTLRRALELDPGSRLARHALPVAVLRSGELGEGIELLEGMAQEFPRDQEVLITLARAYLARGDQVAARRALDAATRISPLDEQLERLRQELSRD